MMKRNAWPTIKVRKERLGQDFFEGFELFREYSLPHTIQTPYIPSEYVNSGVADSGRTCSVHWLTKDDVPMMMKAEV